ncbi:hypothetical protein TgHK011_004251 [Trichoderma gracile]|nr:hypothetical protein TgHK011_004251 [Trichoderma gracile]
MIASGMYGVESRAAQNGDNVTTAETQLDNMNRLPSSSAPIVTCRRSARASSSSSPASSSSVHQGPIRPTAGLVHAYPAPRDSTVHGSSPLAHSKRCGQNLLLLRSTYIRSTTARVLQHASQDVLRTLQQHRQLDRFGLLADSGGQISPAAGMD